MATTVVTSGVGGTDGVAPGTSGNVLTSDGTDWTSAAAAGGGAWNFIASATASTSASLDFTTGIGGTYDNYVVILQHIHVATSGAELMIRLSDDAGSSFKSSSYLNHLTKSESNADTYTGENGSGQGLYVGQNVKSDASEGYSGMAYLYGLAEASKAVHMSCHGFTKLQASGNASMQHGSGTYNGSAITENAIQVICDTGNITAGTVSLYGISPS